MKFLSLEFCKFKFSIKELRLKNGLTQKNLADSLYVTYQAVSRWENGDTEPSFDTLKQMCKIFNCTVSDIFETREDDNKTNGELVCAKCGKVITDESEACQCKQCECDKGILCDACSKEIAFEAKEKHKKTLKNRRISVFILCPILLLSCVGCAIYFYFTSSIGLMITFLALGIFLFCSVSTLLFRNTFVSYLFEGIFKWGQDQYRLIFGLDFDSKLFLKIAKILFAVLASPIVVVVYLIVAIISLIFGFFMYPVALIGNIKGI